MSKSSDQDYIDALLVERAMMVQGKKKERLAAVEAELSRVGYEEADAKPEKLERAVVKREAAKPTAPKAKAAEAKPEPAKPWSWEAPKADN